jgi:hypothetical protein
METPYKFKKHHKFAKEHCSSVPDQHPHEYAPETELSQTQFSRVFYVSKKTALLWVEPKQSQLYFRDVSKKRA